MKLIVLNLPRNFTEEDLARFFKSHGDIKSCDLVMDKENGTSKGFGFVEMALDHEGLNVIQQLHGSEIDGNKIRVKQAE